MRLSFFPKEVEFFDLFDKLVESAVAASRMFRDLTLSAQYDESSIKKMHDIEHDGDEATHTILNKLDTTFITPFDREDIHALATQMDDVVDLIYTTTRRLKVFKIKELNDDISHFAETIEKSVSALASAVKGLRNKKQAKAVLDYCIEVHRLENVGDMLRDSSIGALFDNAKDPIYVIKWKELFQEAETVLDKCEDVANIVQTIMVKQA